MCSYHDGGEVLTLKAADGVVQRLVHCCRDPLGDQAVQVDGATKQLQDGERNGYRWSRGVFYTGQNDGCQSCSSTCTCLCLSSVS